MKKNNKPQITGINAPPSRATTDEGREKELINLSYALVEKRLREGTASAMETVHFLKLGSSRERLEQMKMEHDIKLSEAKTDNLERDKRIESLYADAMNAFRSYNGEDGEL